MPRNEWWKTVNLPFVLELCFCKSMESTIGTYFRCLCCMMKWKYIVEIILEYSCKNIIIFSIFVIAIKFCQIFFSLKTWIFQTIISIVCFDASILLRQLCDSVCWWYYACGFIVNLDVIGRRTRKISSNWVILSCENGI